MYRLARSSETATSFTVQRFTGQPQGQEEKDANLLEVITANHPLDLWAITTDLITLPPPVI